MKRGIWQKRRISSIAFRTKRYALHGQLGYFPMKKSTRISGNLSIFPGDFVPFPEISHKCMRASNIDSHNRTECAGYFYQDGIIKYDRSLTSQIEGTISKKTILLRKDITFLEPS